MYHVHPDKRTQRSAGKLSDALTKLLESTPLQKVTVSALCREARVARTTFYRSFDNLEDVISWHLTWELRESAWHLPKMWPDREREHLVHIAMSRLRGEEPLLRCLVRDSRIDLLESSFAYIAPLFAGRLAPELDQNALAALSRNLSLAGAPFVGALVSAGLGSGTPREHTGWTDGLVKAFSARPVPDLDIVTHAFASTKMGTSANTNASVGTKAKPNVNVWAC